MKWKCFLLVTGILLFTAPFIEAVAIQVKPSKIEIDTESGVLVKKEIFLENSTNQITFYEIYPDEFSEVF